MQQPSTQFPFEHVYFTQQPFGIRVRCVLDSELIKRQHQITGLAIEATGGMEPYFGMGAFSKGIVKQIGQSLGEFLGKLDKREGTSVIYWGTNDTTSIQPLGFRQSAEWHFFSFTRPSVGFGKKSNLQPALKYFLEGDHSSVWTASGTGQEGIFVFLLDGKLDDYPIVLDYLGQFTAEIIGQRRKMSHLVFVGIGENFIEVSRGQLQAIASYSGRSEPPMITSLAVNSLTDVVDNIKDVVMTYTRVAESGSILNNKGQLIQNFPNGLPGAFQFYIPSGTTSFTLNMEGILYTQTISG